MHVNSGGGLPPAPNNSNPAGGQPQPAPPQQGPTPNASMVSATAATVSPLEPPVAADTILDSTQPTLTANQSFALNFNKLRADWLQVEKAIREGDIKLVHRMLDEGLVPRLVQQDEDGSGMSVSLPSTLFKHLQDIDLFDRLIELFTEHDLQPDLYRLVSQAGNGILLRRLVQSRVDGAQAVPLQLSGLVARAIVSGDAKQLDALLQLKKEHYTTVKFDWNDIWSHVAQSAEKFLSVAVVASLAKHLKPSQFSNENLADLFRRAADTGDRGVVACLVEWLGDALSEFAVCDAWKHVQRNFSLEMFAALVNGGFPQQGMRLPSVRHEQAQEFQLILFGPKLSNSPFMKVSFASDSSSTGVIDFIFECTCDVARGSFLRVLPEALQWLNEDPIANAFFWNGVAPPLALKLAQAMRDYLELTQQHFVSGANDLAYLSCLNECVQPNALKPLQDPLSVEQAEMINEALLKELEQIFGDPIGFYSRALVCINADGSINTAKLGLIYRQGIGLPPKIVAQIGVTLKTLCAEVMASTVPLNLFKPGMNGTEFQAVFHRWLQQSVARRLIHRLPQELGAMIAQREWNDSAKDRESDHHAIEAAELIAPLNYLVTSLIRQYGTILAEDIEANSEAMVEACHALPADAYDHLLQASSESSADDASSESSADDT